MITESEIFVGPPSVLGLGYPLEIPHLDKLIGPRFLRGTEQRISYPWDYRNLNDITGSVQACGKR